MNVIVIVNVMFRLENDERYRIKYLKFIMNL